MDFKRRMSFIIRFFLFFHRFRPADIYAYFVHIAGIFVLLRSDVSVALATVGKASFILQDCHTRPSSFLSLARKDGPTRRIPVILPLSKQEILQFDTPHPGKPGNAISSLAIGGNLRYNTDNPKLHRQSFRRTPRTAFPTL